LSGGRWRSWSQSDGRRGWVVCCGGWWWWWCIYRWRRDYGALEEVLGDGLEESFVDFTRKTGVVR